MLQDGKPWSAYRREALDAFEAYSFCKDFGWTPKTFRHFKESDYETYMAFKSIKKGFGEANND